MHIQASFYKQFEKDKEIENVRREKINKIIWKDIISIPGYQICKYNNILQIRNKLSKKN
jgi:hypothetical protein